MPSSIPPSRLQPPVQWTPKRRRTALRALMAVFGASVIAVAWLVTSYLSHVQQRREMALNDERIKANIVKARVDSALRDLPDYAKRLSARLSDALSSPTTALSATASLGSGADCQMILLRSALISPCAIMALRLRL